MSYLNWMMLSSCTKTRTYTGKRLKISARWETWGSQFIRVLPTLNRTSIDGVAGEPRQRGKCRSVVTKQFLKTSSRFKILSQTDASTCTRWTSLAKTWTMLSQSIYLPMKMEKAMCILKRSFQMTIRHNSGLSIKRPRPSSLYTSASNRTRDECSITIPTSRTT